MARYSKRIDVFALFLFPLDVIEHSEVFDYAVLWLRVITTLFGSMDG